MSKNRWVLGAGAMLDYLELLHPRCHGEAHNLGAYRPSWASWDLEPGAWDFAGKWTRPQGISGIRKRTRSSPL